MKKPLLALLLLNVVGCKTAPYYWETEAYKEAVEDRKAMLTDGRIHIGMTDNEFAKLWGRDIYPDRTVHPWGTIEWWTYDSDCEPRGGRFIHYSFCFENGILVYWSEN